MSLSLRSVLDLPSTKVPINITTFVSYVVPPLACYVLAAVLVIIPQTRTFRFALWPVVMLLAFRAISVDLSQGNPEQKFLNIDYVVRLSLLQNPPLTTYTLAFVSTP